jgi:hypothetical protein
MSSSRRLYIPQPKLGDVFVKKHAQSGQIERVLITSLCHLERPKKDEDWSALITSVKTVDARITSSPSDSGRFFTEADWRPENWIPYNGGACYGPKGLVWIVTINELVPEDSIDWAMLPAPFKDEPRGKWEDRVKSSEVDGGMGDIFCKLPKFQGCLDDCWSKNQPSKPARKETKE